MSLLSIAEIKIVWLAAFLSSQSSSSAKDSVKVVPSTMPTIFLAQSWMQVCNFQTRKFSSNSFSMCTEFPKSCLTQDCILAGSGIRLWVDLWRISSSETGAVCVWEGLLRVSASIIGRTEKVQWHGIWGTVIYIKNRVFQNESKVIFWLNHGSIVSQIIQYKSGPITYWKCKR